MKQHIKSLLPGVAINSLRHIKNKGRNLASAIGALKPIKIPSNARILKSPTSQLFFGYYDVSPFSADNTKLLAMRSTLRSQSPHDVNTPLEIGFYDLSLQSPDFQILATTQSWNWQQGCRLQWFPQPDGREAIFYNIAQNRQYRGVIQDFKTQEILQTLPCALYAINTKGTQGLTLNFTRLHHFRRGYGYHQQADRNLSQSAPADDGVFNVDIKTGQKKLIISLEKLATLQTDEQTSFHYINHLHFNPSGTRIMFFHIQTNMRGQRKVRLITTTPEGQEIKPLNYDIKPSHYHWMDDTTLLITGENSAGKTMYILYCIKTDHITQIGQGILTEDGHPSMINNNVMLSDTYPNLWGHQYLFKYHLNDNTKQTIASFHHPAIFRQEMRCDFHPRLSPDKSQICIDIIHRHNRALCIIPTKVITS